MLHILTLAENIVLQNMKELRLKKTAVLPFDITLILCGYAEDLWQVNDDLLTPSLRLAYKQSISEIKQHREKLWDLHLSAY